MKPVVTGAGKCPEHRKGVKVMIEELLFDPADPVYEDENYIVWDDGSSSVILQFKGSGLTIRFSYEEWRALRSDVLDPDEDENPYITDLHAIWENMDYAGNSVTGLYLIERGCLLSFSDWDSFRRMLIRAR
jgi:hypothetical protein